MAARRVAELGATLDQMLGNAPDERASSPTVNAPATSVPAADALQLLSKTSEGLLVLDESLRVTYASAGLQRLLGYEGRDPRGSGLDMVHPEDWPTVRGATEFLLAREGGAANFELRAEHADGRWIWLDARATNLLEEPGVKGVVLTVRDISERKSSEDELRHRALHDTLTGLPNRTLLIDRLSGAIWRSGRDGRLITVFFLDLDAFKEVNDSLGHAAGDEVLSGVAGRLGAVARTQDTVARYGGDEFVLVVEHDQESDWVSTFAERLRSIFREPIRADGRLVTVTASFGIATAAGTMPSPESLLRDADAAMYRAKRSGGDSYVVFDDTMIDQPVVDLTADN